MNKIFFSIILIIATALAARGAEDVYNPIAVGLRWEHSVVLTMPDGRTFNGTMTREITGTKVIAGKTYFVSYTRFSGLPGMQPFTTYRRKAADGIYAINGFDPKKREYLETALPLSVGKTWQAVTDDTTTITVAAQEDLTVGDRKYEKCFKIVSSADGLSPSGTYYLAPNIGNIRDSSKQGGATFEFTLTKFTGTK